MAWQEWESGKVKSKQKDEHENCDDCEYCNTNRKAMAIIILCVGSVVVVTAFVEFLRWLSS